MNQETVEYIIECLYEKRIEISQRDNNRSVLPLEKYNKIKELVKVDDCIRELMELRE